MSRENPAQGRTVSLRTDREEFRDYSSAMLNKIAQEAPEAAVVVYKLNGRIYVDAACVNSLEVVGALQMAISDLCCPE